MKSDTTTFYTVKAQYKTFSRIIEDQVPTLTSAKKIAKEFYHRTKKKPRRVVLVRNRTVHYKKELFLNP